MPTARSVRPFFQPLDHGIGVRIPASQPPLSLFSFSRLVSAAPFLGFDQLASLAALGTNPCLPANSLAHFIRSLGGCWPGSRLRSARFARCSRHESLPPSHLAHSIFFPPLLLVALVLFFAICA